MEKPSISMPSWMVVEIEERRPKGTRRSEWVRQAVMARIEAEDAGTWEAPDVEQPNAPPVEGG